MIHPRDARAARRAVVRVRRLRGAARDAQRAPGEAPSRVRDARVEVVVEDPFLHGGVERARRLTFHLP
eukprot:30779-Pelagococcus_subviridis.AAC.2